MFIHSACLWGICSKMPAARATLPTRTLHQFVFYSVEYVWITHPKGWHYIMCVFLMVITRSLKGKMLFSALTLHRNVSVSCRTLLQIGSDWSQSYFSKQNVPAQAFWININLCSVSLVCKCKLFHCCWC